MILKFNNVKLYVRDIAKVRGYFSNHFRDKELLHNHLPGGKYCYKFPKIQYRLIDNNPALIAIDEGIDVLKEVFFLNDEIVINNRTYTLEEKEIISKECEFGQCEEFIKYKFISPYMALNQDNYHKYIEFNSVAKNNFLKQLVKSNLKTISKGFKYTIPNIDEILVEGYFEEKAVNFKNLKMICFRGQFMTNFNIPDYWGLGKQTARGFGVVKKV